jgi:ribonuclease P protein component
LESPTHQVLITVSSRNFKRAVDRNSVKRRIREAYRLNKESLITPKKLLLAYIYVAKEILPSAIIHEKLIRANEIIVRRNEKVS